MKPTLIHLRAAGSSLVLHTRGAVVPSVIHWGSDVSLDEAPDLPVGPSALDQPRRPGIIPLLSDGWSGQQGLEGFHLDGNFRHPSLQLENIDSDVSTAELTLVDNLDHPRLRATVSLRLTPTGVLLTRTALANLAPAPFVLSSVALALPVPRAAESLDFAGHWSHERTPQRRALATGAWVRESRHGRPGHDDSFVTIVGSPGFSFESGEVWASHLAWSGDKRSTIDASATGTVLVGLGELLAPGEVVLAPGETYESPWALHAHSTTGLNGISDLFHAHFRTLDAHPETPRPITLNTWEAVYFDHDAARLDSLARAAAAAGVERFVLDDGWMTGRTDAKRALGDWTVDSAKYPSGLHPLTTRVTELGMQFGLWVEPEMISLDSNVAREHPDWILRDSGSDLPLSWRDQHVIDLGNADAFEHVRASLLALLEEYPISYLKWDMNRDLLGGSAHRHVLRLYELLDLVRHAFPTVEIESCSSGGARIDAGILTRTQRVWPSDTNDPRERQAIQKWTSLLIPLEYLGSHVGAATAHTTGRTSSLSYRLATAFFGHAGIEWDVAAVPQSDLDALAVWADAYRKHRPLLHSGRLVRADSSPDRSTFGIVSATSALFSVAQIASPPVSAPAPERLVGLEPSRRYRVSPVDLGAATSIYPGTAPAWWQAGSLIATGETLATVGISLPLLHPDEAVVLFAEAF